MIAVAAFGLGILTWIAWPVRPEGPRALLQPHVVQGFTITADGKPLPDAYWKSTQVFLNVRFALPAPKANPRRTVLVILANADEPYVGRELVTKLFRNHPAGAGPRLGFLRMETGRVVDDAPPPPPEDDPALYFCGPLDLSHLPKGVDPSKPLELHVWVYQEDAEEQTEWKSGVLVFVHRFRAPG